MKVKEFFSNWIVRNLLLAAFLVAAVVGVTSILLSLITQHNKEIKVPDFTGLTASEAAKAASKAGVRTLVVDSVYVKRMKPGAVYMQTPKAGSSVKKGRRVRLTTNTVSPKEVYMPSLVGYSLRQAKAELLRSGLSLGRLIYTHDIATNTVLKQQVRGRDIPAGFPLTSGESVNLVLGLNEDDAYTNIPNLSGRKYLDAVDVLKENSLNLGGLRFDAGVHTYSDSLSSVVYSSRPSYASSAVRKGTAVILYLKPSEDGGGSSNGE